MQTRGWRVGIDIGGTFTDIFALEPRKGAEREAKVPTRSRDPLASLKAALAAVGLDWPEVGVLVQGTTLVTNAIVENRLAPVALVSTEGFRDVIAIGRQNRLHLYRLAPPPKPQCLVPERLRFEVRERMGPGGEVIAPLDPAQAEMVAAEIARSGVRSVAVSLLHSYSNPSHELELEAVLRSVAPHVSLSHRVNPEEREFERTNAAVLNAAVRPLLAEYLRELRAAIPTHTQLHLFHSAGGMVSAETASENPLMLALSGPAAGVAATCQIVSELGLERAIAFDMGGTTTDVCLIRQGLPELGFGKSIAGYQFRQPMIAVESIGAGGGSIARLDRGALKVGPQSAGADPGPACYGRGGTEPTLSDANLVLGYLDAERPLGGSVHLKRDLAYSTVAALAQQLGIGTVETAFGIVRVAITNMARALRNITVEKGVDGRSCVLVAYGGAGPMHAAALARQFGITRVVVPRASGMLSALGCALAGPSYTRQRSMRMSSLAWRADAFAATRHAMLEDALAALRLSPHAGGFRVEDVALIRYAGQSYSIEVPYAELGDPAVIGQDFRRAHETLYGFSNDEPWEVEALRVRVSLPGFGSINGARESREYEFVAGSRLCWFKADAPVTTPRLWRGGLKARETLAGPGLIVDEWSTVVVPPYATLTADERGNLLMDVGAA
jgi:N-methylhydantoinase A